MLTVAVALGACGSDSPYKSRDEMLDPETCMQCHPDHYEQWSGSMHAYAADDPVFLAMNARGQRETGGALGSFCVNCHAPMAVREGATTDGLDLADVPRPLKGVTCFFCHSVDSVDGDHNNPLHLSDQVVMHGEYSNPVANEGHRAVYSNLHDRDLAASAGLCGSCHDIVVNGHAAIERTFAEWQATVFSQPGGATCGQCHMDQDPTPRPIANVEGTFARRFHSHLFPGVDQALTEFPGVTAQRAAVKKFLDTTLQTAICVVPVGSGAAIRIVTDNVAAGHGFPSGSGQDRRLWFEVIAYQGDTPSYQSGVVADDQAVVDSTDPDLWLLRDCMLDSDGQPVDMFWEADSYETNQLPGQITFDATDPRFYQTHIVQAFPRNFNTTLGFIPDSVTLRVRLRPMGREVLGDLVDSGDLDAALVDQMPTYDLDLGDGPVLTWTAATADQQYFDADLNQLGTCISLTNLNATVDRVKAPTRPSCSP